VRFRIGTEHIFELLDNDDHRLLFSGAFLFTGIKSHLSTHLPTYLQDNQRDFLDNQISSIVSYSYNHRNNNKPLHTALYRGEQLSYQGAIPSGLPIAPLEINI
jgi:hypothetical protein